MSSTWTSVEDALPDDDISVLAVTDEDLIHIAALRLGFWRGEDGSTALPVTHWQHLPATPAEELGSAPRTSDIEDDAP